jgi:hypothetical protein
MIVHVNLCESRPPPYLVAIDGDQSAFQNHSSGPAKDARWMISAIADFPLVQDSFWQVSVNCEASQQIGSSPARKPTRQTSSHGTSHRSGTNDRNCWHLIRLRVYRGRRCFCSKALAACLTKTQGRACQPRSCSSLRLAALEPCPNSLQNRWVELKWKRSVKLL